MGEGALKIDPQGEKVTVEEALPASRKPGIHRRLYAWVLHWAETPYGPMALFLLAFAESSFFPIPPDVLLIALVLGKKTRWLLFALLCTVASVAGGLLGYYIGASFMGVVGYKIIAFYHAEAYYAQVTTWYELYDYWIVFISAFTPIPYKVFTIASGAFEMNVAGFVLVSAIGRGARFFLVAWLLYYFGAPIQRFIDRYFNILCVAFVLMLVGGFYVLKIM